MRENPRTYTLRFNLGTPGTERHSTFWAMPIIRRLEDGCWRFESSESRWFLVLSPNSLWTLEGHE